MPRQPAAAVTERVSAALDTTPRTAREVAQAAGVRVYRNVFTHLRLLVVQGKAEALSAFGQHDRYRRTS